MKYATLIVLAFGAAIFCLAAFLKQPAVLLALGFLPSMLQELPYGLLTHAQAHGDPAPDEDEPQPMGFTQDVKSK